ncbi:MAG: sulfatase family protein [Akkermansiaceae bacterium]
MKPLLICLTLLVLNRGHADPVPNIVVFLADDMGMGDTSAYQTWSGNPDSAQLHTPALEKLAADGIRFTDAHSPSSRCTPSRYALLTGRYCWRTHLKSWVLFGVHGDPLIERERTTLPEFLRDSGYTTGMVGKWHLGLTYRQANGQPAEGWKDADLTKPIFDGPLDHGFDFFHGFSRSHATSGPNKVGKRGVANTPDQKRGPGWIHGRKITGATGNGKQLDGSYVLHEIGGVLDAQSRKFLDSANAKEKPFFLYFASHINHSPYTPDKRIGNHKIVGASRNKDGSPTNSVRLDFIYENDVLVSRLRDYLATTDDPRRPGKKLIENTLFIFSSDNGSENKNKQFTGPLRSNKGSVYDGGHRVPFLASWPLGGVNGGKESTRLLGLNDLFATTAAILDKPLPPLKGKGRGAEDSVNQLAALQGKACPPRIPIIPNDHNEGGSNNREKSWVAIRSNAGPKPGQWKLFLDHTYAWEQKFNPRELYNLATDPMEKDNLLQSEEHKDVLDFLLKQAGQAMGDNGSTRQLQK